MEGSWFWHKIQGLVQASAGYCQKAIKEHNFWRLEYASLCIVQYKILLQKALRKGFAR